MNLSQSSYSQYSYLESLQSLNTSLSSKESAVSALLDILSEHSVSSNALEAENYDLQAQINIYATEVMELQRTLTSLQVEFSSSA